MVGLLSYMDDVDSAVRVLDNAVSHAETQASIQDNSLWSVHQFRIAKEFRNIA